MCKMSSLKEKIVSIMKKFITDTIESGGIEGIRTLTAMYLKHVPPSCWATIP